MLMDEPFGAVDPINRERLQNEFLRLQAELRKTILFVTHDIDEAIKMGDRIAVLREGGKVAQYATPAELLMAPADELRRGLRRRRPGAEAARAAARVRHRPLGGAARSRRPVDRRGPREARRAPRCRTLSSSTPSRRPLGWLSDADLAREHVPDKPDTGPDPILDRDDVMRDALSDLLQAETQYGPVVDSDGRIAGVLSVEIISDFLSSKEAAGGGAPTRADRPLD